MTEDGRRLLKDIVENQTQIKVATLNPSTGMVEYQFPTHYHKYPYEGKMFHQGGQSIDLMTTPDHMIWARTTGESRLRKPYHLVEAQKAVRGLQYQRNFPWDNGELLENDFILPAYDSNMIHRPNREFSVGRLASFIRYLYQRG